MFQHKRIHQASWYPPNAKAQPSLKDYILVQQRMRSFILNTRVYRGADIDSNHQLVVTSIVLKLNRPRKKIMKSKFNIGLLAHDHVQSALMERIQDRFNRRCTNVEVNCRYSEMTFWKVSNNNRGITLLSIPRKVLSLILLERLQTIIDPQLLDSQCGFRKGRGMVHQSWVTRQRANEYQTPIFLGSYVPRVCGSDQGLRYCGSFLVGRHPETLRSHT